MSRKYIKQINDLDFVYPNSRLAEYDVDIVHDINDNCVSGTVTSFSATTVSTTGITFTISDTWSLNGAEPFIRNSNNLAIYSVHMLAPGQNYYKPWRVVSSRSVTPYTGQTSFSETGATFSVTPALVGVSTFTNGLYYFEVRFIGHRCIYPVCVQLNISTIPSPTPTPTATPTATPTPTPTSTTPGVCCVSGVTLNVTDTGWVKWTLCDGTQEYHQYTTTGNKVIPECIQQNTVTYGFPFADLAEFTVTGSGTQCGGNCPTPTPTPTPTATLPGGLTAYDGSGYGNSVADSCNDAINNNRTLYSDCDSGSFGTGCYVYTDTVPNALIGYTNVFMNGANWDVNSATGVITGLSSVQC
jgi:hypothetical protein